MSSRGKAKPFSGGCLCGSVRFEVSGPIGATHTCSCRMCQRHSGAFTTVWAEVSKDAVVWTGEGGPPATYRSSDYSSRAFCAKCGSSLGAIDDKPTVGLLMGCFDRAHLKDFAPVRHSYKGQRPKWWCVSIGEAEKEPATLATSEG